MCMLYGWLECCIIWGEGQVMTRKAVSTNVVHYKQLIIFFQIVILLAWDRVFAMFPSKTGLELMTSLLYLPNSLVDRHTPLLVLLLLLGLDIFEEVIGCSSIDCGSWFERILPIVVVWMVHNCGHGTMRISVTSQWTWRQKQGCSSPLTFSFLHSYSVLGPSPCDGAPSIQDESSLLTSSDLEMPLTMDVNHHSYHAWIFCSECFLACGWLNLWAHKLVLVKVSTAEMKHQNWKASWGGNGLFSSWFDIIKGSQDRNPSRAGTWIQELMQKPGKGAACWTAPYGLFSLLHYRTQEQQPRNGTNHNGLGPPHQSVIKKIL